MSVYGHPGWCPEVDETTAALCTREDGHTGPHEHEDEQGEITARWTHNPTERRTA